MVEFLELPYSAETLALRITLGKTLGLHFGWNVYLPLNDGHADEVLRWVSSEVRIVVWCGG